tara:strand:- start:1082 stop:1453 length:372 start_codon:yes stop_codon:yes gene_type:complete
MKKIILILFFLINLFNNCIAQESNLQLKIYKNLRCLVCQGQSIAGSNSDFAQTIKLVVKDQINQGKSEEEIYNFLIKKYGEWIVYKPEFNKKNFLLWFLPYLVLFFGGILIVFIIKKGKNNRV